MRTIVLLGLVCLVIGTLCASQTDDSWTRVPVTVDDPLHNGCFVDAEYGWIVSYGTGLVLHTRDSGRTWRVQARLDSLFYEGIHFSSRLDGWICGERGTLLRTTDGGETWQARKVAPESVAFYGIRVPRDGLALLVGIDMSRRRAALLESRDGGASWNAHGDSVPGMALEPIQFLDDQYGFIGGGREVLRTTNGGESWTAVDVGQRTVIRGIYFRDRDHGWAVGHGGAVLRTDDGGLSWRMLDRFTENRLRSILFIDDQRGFIVGDRQREPVSMWSTSDGGSTWIGDETQYPDLHRLFAGAGATWAVGKSATILRTN